MTRKKVIIAILVVLVLAAIGYANFGFKRSTAVAVTIEKVELRDLESIVSASGKIQAKKTINISAETMGKVVNLAVNEGESVKAGQHLLQIDPRNLETQVQNREASLNRARSQLDQTRASVENAKLAVKQAEDNMRRAEGQMKSGLIARELYERAQNDLKRAQTDLRATEQSVITQQASIKQEEANLENAKVDLNKVRIVSPIDGIVTRRNIEEGETAVVGTMNNAGTVLLVIADLSVIETEIEVDETDIPDIHIGQPVKVTIDAIPDKTFPGKVTEVGNSPIVVAGGAAQRATNFKVVVTIDGTVPNVRPGFTCTAVITTATRKRTVSVPIQAMTLRELIVDEKGQIIKEPPPAPGRGRRSGGPAPPVEPKPGQTRKEIEGVYVVANSHVTFTPVKTGIAGEKYFEVLEGLKEGDEVVTGPFASVRNLKDGDEVRPQAARPTGQTGS
jgi:HlyD family secretion protein